MITTRSVTTERFTDLANLFRSNSTTRGCWCMAYCSPRAEWTARWGTGGNRAAFETMAATAERPVGVLAYEQDVPVGWLSVGPRSRYVVATSSRSKVMRHRDPAEDDRVWLAACFFVRVGHRSRGITHMLLDGGVDLARSAGATAVEGWPRSGADRRQSDLYFGRESVFVTHGFHVVDRPSPQRAVVRLELR